MGRVDHKPDQKPIKSPSPQPSPASGRGSRPREVVNLRHPSPACGRGAGGEGLLILLLAPFIAGRMESPCRGLSRRDAARGTSGHGRPVVPCPRSGDGMREPAAQRRAKVGARPFGFFWVVRQSGNAKRNSRVRRETKRSAHAIKQNSDISQSTSNRQKPIAPLQSPPYSPAVAAHQRLGLATHVQLRISAHL